MRSPGEPLNPVQVAGVQGALPIGGFLVPSHSVNVGSGHYTMDTPTLLPVPLVPAQYASYDVPFTPQRTDHQQ